MEKTGQPEHLSRVDRGRSAVARTLTAGLGLLPGRAEIAVGQKAKLRGDKSAKRRRFELHSWLGFHLALITSIVLLTGTIATISNEIDWLIQDDMRVSPDGDTVSWGTMESAVRQAAPDDMMIALQRGEDDHFAHRAIMVRPDGTSYFVHVDQWTGNNTGTTHPLTVQRFFRDLHRYLFMPRAIRLPIVCSMGIVLLLSLYTGLRTAGRWRKAATRLRTNKGSRILVGDAHKAAGIWASWFLVIIAVTGIWYLIEFGGQAAGKSFEPPRPGPSEAQLAERGDVLPQLSADRFVETAIEALPGLTPTRIHYPTRLDGAVMVWGRSSDPLVRDRANRVSIDPADGSVIGVFRSNESGALA